MVQGGVTLSSGVIQNKSTLWCHDGPYDLQRENFRVIGSRSGSPGSRDGRVVWAGRTAAC